MGEEKEVGGSSQQQHGQQGDPAGHQWEEQGPGIQGDAHSPSPSRQAERTLLQSSEHFLFKNDPSWWIC